MDERAGWSTEDVQRWNEARAEDARARAVSTTAVAETVIAIIMPGLAWVWCAALMLRPFPPARGKAVLMGIYAALNCALLYVAIRLRAA